MAYNTVNGRFCRTNHDFLVTTSSTNIANQVGRVM